METFLCQTYSSWFLLFSSSQQGSTDLHEAQLAQSVKFDTFDSLQQPF